MSDKKQDKQNADQETGEQSSKVPKIGQGAVRKPAPDGSSGEPLPPGSKG
jgi:hypothetical protein